MSGSPSVAAVTTVLEDLLAQARPVDDLIHESGSSHSIFVSTRMHVSARHVSAVVLGAALEQAWSGHGEALAHVFPGLDHGCITTAAQSLVFANAVTALDMCASSGAMWCGAAPLKHGREHDLANLITRHPSMKPVRPDWAAPWLNDWVDGLIADPRFAELWAKRDEQTHRIVQRSASVTPATIGGRTTEQTSGRSTFGPTGGPSEPEVSSTYANCVRLTRDRWFAFWIALGANP